MSDNYLTDVNELFAEDMKNPKYVNEYNAEMNRLASAVAIRKERESYGWTQEQLAKEAGVPQSTVARIESGANTSMDTISKIATAFGKSLQISFT